MEHFSEEYSKLLLSKEWLVKIDTAKSTPYLFKFYCSMVDLTCWVLLTDTKSVWAEVLNGKQFARRWRDCNPAAPSPLQQVDDEEAWRTSILELLSKAHTIGSIADLSFEIVDSNFADVAFELECDVFRWKWETCYMGPKSSVEIISKHLILPLISVTHLALTSPDAVSAMSDSDVEKAIDKVGRTARRTLDTHVKNVLSKPRVTTALRRMTTIFNFLPELPAVTSTAEKPNLQSALQEAETLIRPSSLVKAHNDMPTSLIPKNMSSHGKEKEPSKPSVDLDSATESDADSDSDLLKKGHEREESSKPSLYNKPSSLLPTQGSSASKRPSPDASPSKDLTSSKKEDSEADSSPLPLPPAKKTKKSKSLSSSDENSEEEHRRRTTQQKSSSGGVKRGTRQPIKRGGKRF